MKPAMIHRPIWIAAILLLSACVAPLLVAPGDISDEADVSSGASTAQILGTTRGVIEPDTCHVEEPERTKKLTVDAGMVSLVVACFYYGDMGPSRRQYAAVEFLAAEGHRYSVRKADTTTLNGIDVVDLTDRRNLVARTILARGRADAAMTIGRALVFVSGDLGRGRPGDLRCGLRNADTAGGESLEKLETNWRRILNKHVVDPGQLAVQVTCSEWSSSFGPMKSKEKRRHSTIVHIDAKAGRLYAVDLDLSEGACVVVTDVTTKDEKASDCIPMTSQDVD